MEKEKIIHSGSYIANHPFVIYASGAHVRALIADSEAVIYYVEQTS